MQYTIRGIPPDVDKALRKRARTTGQSLNETALAALSEGAGVLGARRKRRDLSDLIGSWTPDDELEAELAAQRVIDEEIWR
jgi:hypothetical protein